ncbi:MAG TPA: ketopantoate reductase family protein [Tissierellia bacterium]|nr:ketopantoate reductase family protein [Tissierellia bacterium]
MRIAIMGAGSLGTILGAYISKAGYAIDLIDPYKEHVDALNKEGARIIGTVNFTQPVHAITPDEMEGVYDLIIYMAKQTYNDTAIPQIKAHIDENSTVCVCQNGIPEYAVSEAVGVEKVVGAPVGWGATFQGPGCSALTTDEGRLNFTLGSLEGEVNERVLKTKKILECMGEVVVSENLISLRWTKLLMNATFSGLSTALGTTFGGVLDDDVAMKLILKIGKECLDVAAEKGITLEPYEGYDFYQAFKRGDEKTNQESIKLIREIWKPHYKLTASMAQDLINGRKCEIYDINGIVCKAGKECGIPTPVNERVVKIVAGIQDGIYEYSKNNMEFFKDLV